MNIENGIISSAPGRICLFGEHQDYLNLPVIPAAISLRTNIYAKRSNTLEVNLDLPDINSFEKFSMNEVLPYSKKRDYFVSALNVLRKRNYNFSKGVDAKVKGSIPINSGTSSSSALIVAWLKALAVLSNQKALLSPADVAELAFQAEVAEFNEPGGKMDHYATAVGGIIFLDFMPDTNFEVLPNQLKSFVLGDSQQPKDTIGILSRVKNPIEEAFKKIFAKEQSFNFRTINIEELERYKTILDNNEFDLLIAAKKNYEITMAAKEEFLKPKLNHKKIGELLFAQQTILRDNLKISTQRIDKMIDAGMEAGAYGGKINGSGGGGCMFVYAPENTEEIAESIKRVAGETFIITTDEGVKLQELS